MKLRWIARTLTLLFFTFITLNAFADEYKFDPSHTSVTWKISHLGFSTYSGKWFANGTLMLDPKSPDKSKLDITIDMKSLVTGDNALNEHLASKEFFDFDTYPKATYVSDKIELIGKDKAKVYGTLTVHGVSKPVMLDVTLNKMAENPYVKAEAVGFSATTTIKRSDFGVSGYLPALADTVKLEIEAEALQVKK